MAGEIEKLPERFLSAVLGVNASGTAGLMGVNRCPNLVALYGDSLVAQVYMDAAGARLRRSVYNSINIANALTGQRMIFVAKRAISGWRSDQILERFLADVAAGTLQASNAGTLIFTMGTNDVAQASFTDVVSERPVTLANVAANIAENAARLIDTCAALGIQCIFRTIHGASNYSAEQIGAMEDANRLICALPRGRRLWLVETRDALRNPLATTTSAIAFRDGAMAADPGPLHVHEGIMGALAVGRRLAAVVSAAIPPLPSAYADAATVYSASLSAEIHNNSAFNGSGGTLGVGGTLGTNASGGALAGVPGNWTVRRSSSDSTTTFTVNVGEDHAGRYLEIAATATGSGAVWLQQEPAISRIANGDMLQGFVTVEILSGAVNLAMACPSLEVNGTTGGAASSIFAQGCGHPGGVAYGAFPSDETLVFDDATEILTVPDYDTRNWMVCRAVALSFIGAGSATVRVRRPRFEKVAPAPAIAA